MYFVRLRCGECGRSYTFPNHAEGDERACPYCHPELFVLMDEEPT